MDPEEIESKDRKLISLAQNLDQRRNFVLKLSFLLFEI